MLQHCDWPQNVHSSTFWWRSNATFCKFFDISNTHCIFHLLLHCFYISCAFIFHMITLQKCKKGQKVAISIHRVLCHSKIRTSKNEVWPHGVQPLSHHTTGAVGGAGCALVSTWMGVTWWTTPYNFGELWRNATFARNHFGQNEGQTELQCDQGFRMS